MNKLFIDNESYNIEEDNITISQIKRKNLRKMVN